MTNLYLKFLYNFNKIYEYVVKYAVKIKMINYYTW